MTTHTNTNMFEQIYDIILGVGFIVLSILTLVQLTATIIYAIDDNSIDDDKSESDDDKSESDDDKSESDDDNDNNNIFTPPPRLRKKRANCNSPLILLKIK